MSLFHALRKILFYPPHVSARKAFRLLKGRVTDARVAESICRRRPTPLLQPAPVLLSRVASFAISKQRPWSVSGPTPEPSPA